ncbi:MAG: stalk domain-containing protein, partial [Fimbriimonadales bacterium]|nr:stalk domain-containing protein [Fimbriimonadales bacterium]
IEAWSFDGSQTVKSPMTRVFVNNPGGRTERQLPAQSDEQLGLNEPALATPATAPERVESTLRLPERIEGWLAAESRLSQPLAELPAHKPAPPARSAPQEAYRATEPLRAPAESYRVAEATVQPSGAERLSAPPVEPAPSEMGMLATPVHRASGWGGSAMSLRSSDTAPRMRGQKLAAPPQVALAPSAPAARSSARASWLPITFGTRLPAGITRYEVLLDARPVPFDVAPRVQNGIPLVAVRQIAEQAGGKVRWDHQQKVATIELAGRTLTLDVRANRATLNGATLPLETPLQIIDGRVMVPASMLGDALNAELAFDPSARQLHLSTR